MLFDVIYIKFCFHSIFICVSLSFCMRLVVWIPLDGSQVNKRQLGAVIPKVKDLPWRHGHGQSGRICRLLKSCRFAEHSYPLA